MMNKKLWALLPIILFSLFATADGDKTRGIGRYPGRHSEAHIPQRSLPNGYANQAWMHTTWASSSIDYNLTAQLVTDGILTQGEPPRVSVCTSDGELSLRDREKTFDGNKVTSIYVMGDDAFIEYHWTGMAVSTHALRLNAWTAYREQLLQDGYAITVEASDDGTRWREVGALRGKALPGKATRQTAASDPNKQEAVERLPLRLLDEEIPIEAGTYSHLRIRFQMKGCAYWRLYECMFTDDERQMLPSYQFASAWMVQAENHPQWVYVDMARRVTFDKLRLAWIHPARAGRIQASDDALTWRDVAVLGAGKRDEIEEISCQDTARYIRLLLTQPDASGLYALSELEVWGRPALAYAVTEPLPAPHTVSFADGKQQPLDTGWELQRVGYDRWLPATVPATVLSSFIHNGAVPDNTVGNAMRQISESYFNSDFWYRNGFIMDALAPGERVFINLDGINWKAEVFLNGHNLGNIEGAFKRGRFELTPYLLPNDTNWVHILVHKNDHFGAVKVKNAATTDINGGVLGLDNPTFHASIGWDWITSTPGREVGIWNKVWLSKETAIHMSDPCVTTQLGETDTLATMKPVVVLTNQADHPVTTTLRGWIGEIDFAQTVTLEAGEKREVAFRPDDFPQLRRQAMRLWWPNGYGEPFLYDAGFCADGDTLRFKAGLREMAYRDVDTALKLYVNHKRIMVKGGNWGFSETNLNYRDREYDAAVRYHRDMHFTMIRNWVGQTGDEAFFEACDRYGLMVWQDFWLANPWDGPDPKDGNLFADNAADFICRIRRHASIALYCGRNEGYPPDEIDQFLRKAVSTLHPQLGYISSSADEGVSGHGPYCLQPVNYYFNHSSEKLHSEQGIPNIPSEESIRRMLPADQLWPQSDAWGEHDFTMQGAQRGESFCDLMAQMFGRPSSMEQFAHWAQWLNYEGHRAMFEASTSQKGMGLLMWMSHSCWPSMVWQTYDYYLQPTAGYFGVKKACEPLHVLYDPSTGKVRVQNDSGADQSELTAAYTLYNMSGRVVSGAHRTLDIPADARMDAFPVAIPKRMANGKTSAEVFFLRLTLNKGDQVVSHNDYMLPQEEGNYQALLALPRPQATAVTDLHRNGDRWQGMVKVSNPSDTPALMLRLNLLDGDGDQILPVIYSDNYFHLMPHEERTITISFADEDVRQGNPTVQVTSLID